MLYFFPNTAMKNQETTNKPVESFRLRGVSASVFLNETEQDGRPFFKVSLQRSYKTKDGFKSTNSFSRDDLPLVAEVVNDAWRAILKRESEASTDK